MKEKKIITRVRNLEKIEELLSNEPA